MTDDETDDERWYIVFPTIGYVGHGPDTKAECNQIAALLEERTDEIDGAGDPILVDRNGLLALESQRGSRFEYDDHATDPKDVDGGPLGELLEAALSDPEVDA